MNKLVNYVNSNFDIREVYYEIFGKHIPSGKMFCPNPNHNNVNTPAAKCYGNIIHCFSCNKAYTVYDLFKWYKPEKLNEIKSTVILDSQSNSKNTKYPKIKIDRSKSIDFNLSLILESMK